MMEYVDCILCNSKNNSIEQKVKDRFNENSIYDIVKCECGMVFLNPRISSKEISAHYRHQSYEPHYNNKSVRGFLYQIAQKLNNNFKLRIINLFHFKGSILDYGAGNGQFAKFMLKNRWNANFFEPFLEDDSDLNLNKKELKKHSFDVVSMFHSLEHIHDVNETLKTVYSSLNKNGILILTIPNHNAYERKFFRSTWVAYDAPRHLYHFDYETIKLLLNKNKFDIIMAKGVYLDTLYNILMSLNKNIFSFFKFIGIALLSFINILYNKKYSSSILLVCKKNEKIKL